MPFCEKRCNYCDFYSQTSLEEGRLSAYVQALCKEIELYSKKYSSICICDSIFIGGGTPSAIDEKHIANILSCTMEAFSLSENAEISIETNPNSLSYEKLLAYKAAGINRLSIGVQSFCDDDLKFLGRIHSKNQALKAFDEARKAGFSNINLDLMFAFKEGFEKGMEESLSTLVNLRPEHVSFYSLQLEEGTPLYLDYLSKVFEMPDVEKDRKAYAYGVQFLKNAGYEHYEISNFSLKKKECRHNLKYWSMGEYIGIGASASSYLRENSGKKTPDIAGVRRSNVWDMDRYIERVKKAENTDELEFAEIQKNTLSEDMADYVITTMRRMKGLNFRDFKRSYGLDFFEAFPAAKDVLTDYFNRGLIYFDDEIMRFTLEGVSISNAFLAEFV